MADSTELDEPMDLQLVLQTISTSRSRDKAAVDLTDTARQNQVGAGANREHQVYEGMTPLMLASRHGHAEVARLLLEAGADKDGITVHRRTSLMFASPSGHVEIARSLLQAGANKDQQNSDGMAAPMLAAQNDHVEIVRLLLQAGARADFHGVTALILAAKLGNLEIAPLLLEARANKDHRQRDCMTPLMFAIRKAMWRLRACLWKPIPIRTIEAVTA